MAHTLYAAFANFSAALQLLFVLDFRLIVMLLLIHDFRSIIITSMIPFKFSTALSVALRTQG